jgi:hypothetical protein
VCVEISSRSIGGAHSDTSPTSPCLLLELMLEAKLNTSSDMSSTRPIALSTHTHTHTHTHTLYSQLLTSACILACLCLCPCVCVCVRVCVCVSVLTSPNSRGLGASREREREKERERERERGMERAIHGFLGSTGERCSKTETSEREGEEKLFSFCFGLTFSLTNHAHQPKP